MKHLHTIGTFTFSLKDLLAIEGIKYYKEINTKGIKLVSKGGVTNYIPLERRTGKMTKLIETWEKHLNQSNHSSRKDVFPPNKSWDEIIDESNLIKLGFEKIEGKNSVWSYKGFRCSYSKTSKTLFFNDLSFDVSFVFELKKIISMIDHESPKTN